MLRLLFFLALAGGASAQRSVSITEVQPTVRDTVRTVWINGPSHSGKFVGGKLPKFGTGSLKTDTQCTTKDDKFTGYNAAGNSYCERSSDALDKNAHLLLASGRLGVVVDARGLDPTLEIADRELFPKMGSTSGGSARKIYDSLPSSDSSFNFKMTCSDGTTKTYVLGTTAPKFVQAGLVRQGHTVTQVTLSALTFHDSGTGAIVGPCGTFTKTKDPGNNNCKPGVSAHACPSGYPDCQGFVEGQNWGKCYTSCTTPLPNLWAEVSVWGDSVSIELAWDSAYDVATFRTSQQISQQVTCTATVSASLTLNGGAAVTRSASATASLGGRVGLLVKVGKGGASFVGDPSASVANPITVTSPNSGTQVLSRKHMEDVFVEIPTSTKKCGYNMDCATVPLMLFDIVATNPHQTETQTLRLSFSRGYHTRDPSVTKSHPSAEITGFSVQIFDSSTKQATGIPVQISKNWHSGATAAYWAGYDGNWWTASSFLRLPPNSKVSLSLALNYERYGGVPAWSHAQLSIVGYSDKWLWEESALGTGGENMCFDPIGAHTRAMITDVRPKLFDGNWKENVGGGDFLLLFGESGAMQYLKELDPLIHASGPCLSNASYSSVTNDGALSSHVEISGSRTDDFVRIFMKLRYKALKSFKFSRLAFFQAGSETYNYRAVHKEVVVGEASTHTVHTRTCTGGTDRSSSKMYTGGPFRETMGNAGPWWFAFNDNKDTAVISNSNKMVVGDRGLVIRSYKATLGGTEQAGPSFSILCDKVELGTPKGLLNLVKDDFVEIDLEFLVLPRMGSEYDLAKSNIQSRTLNALASMTSWERVKEQATKGQIDVTGEYGTRVESKYPIRACATSQDRMRVKVVGNPLGFVPVVVCGLISPSVPSGTGLWVWPSGASNYTLVRQGDSAVGGNDFWQTNYNRALGTYEIIFNIELTASSTMVAFGTSPDSWPEYKDHNNELTSGGSSSASTSTFLAGFTGGLLLFTTFILC